MTQDLNKGISDIAYNSLNLPRIVDIKNKTTEGRNEYTYSAAGQKLRAIQKWNPNYNTSPVIGSAVNTSALTQLQTTDYVGNKIYENNILKRILVDGGYYQAGNYYFYITDHLGNNRIVANAAAAVVQSTQYYPFGASFADAQPYKYNGKELDKRNGLNMYDYSARWKDDFRFTTVDPLAEKYYSISPYVYVGNNPLKFIDPDGKQIIPVALPPALLGASSPIVAGQAGTLAAPRSIPVRPFLNPEFIQNANNVATRTIQSTRHIPNVPVIDKARLGQKETERRERLSEKEDRNIKDNHNKNIDKNAPDGEGTAKRTIYEIAKQGGAISTIGAAIIGAGIAAKAIMEVKNPDPSKDSYDTHIEQVEKRREQEKEKTRLK